MNWTGKYRIASKVAMLLALLSLAFSAQALERGGAAPEIGLTDLRGQQVSLESLRGKVVIVDFWASWCAPCKEELPVLERLYGKYRAQGLVVVGVGIDNEREAFEKFLGKMKLGFTLVHDAKKEVAGRYKPPRMPSSYVLDRQGKIAFVHEGFKSEDAKKLDEEVASLLKH